MDQNESNRLAKEFCQSFLLEHVDEVKRVIDRVASCQCDYLGGKSCGCTQKNEKDTNTQRMENGGTEADRERKPNFSFSGFTGIETDYAVVNADEKDSIASRKPIDVSSPSASTFVAPKRKTERPLIKQLSCSEQVYDGLNNPYVIMINNVNFKKKPAPRNGAEADTKNLKKFLQKAHFNTVHFHFDMKKDEMMAIFQKAQNDYSLSQHDGLMCFIMSHGNHRGIESADNQFIKVDDITALFRGNQCPQFMTKPKLFFIQACRGEMEDDGFVVPRGPNHVVPDSETDEQLPITMPSDSDFLIAYSTTKDKCAYRRYDVNDECDAYKNQWMGSWFIASLVDVFLAYSHEEDLLTMLTRVNKAMAELYTDMGQKQISCHLSMLTKKIYFQKSVEK